MNPLSVYHVTPTHDGRWQITRLAHDSALMGPGPHGEAPGLAAEQHAPARPVGFETQEKAVEAALTMAEVDVPSRICVHGAHDELEWERFFGEPPFPEELEHVGNRNDPLDWRASRNHEDTHFFVVEAERAKARLHVRGSARRFRRGRRHAGSSA